ncbi:MAG: excinuclease ABC subunit UvrC [bacterium]|nr:excinuclease ABC subunit UvrC [bacterium]
MAETVLSEKLALLPSEPGVYRFLNDRGKIIYVGKAKSLKNRVKSYFAATAAHDPRVSHWVGKVADLAWIVTHNEVEALILEDHLIKTHRPKYNIELKDDKSYPYFQLTIKERFPRLYLVRNPKKDGSLYFGPYVSVKTARAAMSTIRRYFPLRQSKFDLEGTKTYRPCLNKQMGRCLGPCDGEVTPEDYGQLVEKVVWLLKGHHEELLGRLEAEMKAKSEAMRFEEAALVRDQLKAVRNTFTKQRVLSKDRTDRDVLALVRQGGFAGVQLLFLRGGVLLSDDFIFFKEGEQYSDQELLRSAMARLYFAGDKPLPKEILLPMVNDDMEILEEYFVQRRQTKVHLLTPQRGDKKSLMEMAQRNGEDNLKLRMMGAKAEELILEEAQKVLHLARRPNRVECFDISNTMGKNSVASCVVFEENKPYKQDYRIFKIKTVEGPNDFASMEEVLKRRYKRLSEEDAAWPDLIIIDGGKGQLSAAMSILSDLGLDQRDTEVIGLAKGRSEKRQGVEKFEEDYEYVVKPNRKNPVHLRKNSSTLFFLQRIRDEAHRFAITHHRKLRAKAATKSGLEEIPGIGPTKRKALLKHFGSLGAIKAAMPEDLAATPGLSDKDALAVFDYFAEL